MKFLSIYLIMFSLLPFLPARAESDQHSQLEKAEAEFKAGNAAASAEILLQNKVMGSAAYLYNLGTAQFKAGQVGEALAQLLRAHTMRPFDSDIKNNLDVVLSKLDPAARAISPSHWASFLPDYIIENPALLLCITLAFFIAAVLASILRKIAFVLGLVTALLCVGLFVSRPETAVVIQKQLPLRSGPATTFAEISQLVEGAMVSIEERKDGWVKLAFRRANEKSKEAIGWVEESAITSLSK